MFCAVLHYTVRDGTGRDGTALTAFLWSQRLSASLFVCFFYHLFFFFSRLPSPPPLFSSFPFSTPWHLLPLFSYFLFFFVVLVAPFCPPPPPLSLFVSSPRRRAINPCLSIVDTRLAPCSSFHFILHLSCRTSPFYQITRLKIPRNTQEKDKKTTPHQIPTITNHFEVFHCFTAEYNTKVSPQRQANIASFSGVTHLVD